MIWMLVSIIMIAGIIFAEIWLTKRKHKYMGLVFPVFFILVFIFSSIGYMDKDVYVITTDTGEKYSFQSEKEFNKKKESLQEMAENFSVKETITTKKDKTVIIMSGVGALILSAVYIYIGKKESLKKKEYEMFIKDL